MAIKFHAGVAFWAQVSFESGDLIFEVKTREGETANEVHARLCKLIDDHMMSVPCKVVRRGMGKSMVGD